jgi:septal ring factor EnvC (AmiA/AmiB activator)
LFGVQIAKLSQYQEKINSLQEEKITVEKQLSVSHSTMTQLQQQNSSLVAELGEPQRKLLQIHEAGFLTVIVQECVVLNFPALCVGWGRGHGATAPSHLDL